MVDYYDFYEHYKIAQPKTVKNGIRALSRKGEIGSSWWSKKWISILEGFGWENRLERGRRYARSGQVANMEIKPGLVSARVQGTRPKPYIVTIMIPQLDDDRWKKILELMGEQMVFAARLLNGEVPEDAERVFELAGASVFPKSPRDIQTKCSCPDPANPCKHIAAVCYILAEGFDIDPFTMFYLRGRSREEIIASLTPFGIAAGMKAAPAARPATRWRSTKNSKDFWMERQPIEQGCILPRELTVIPLNILQLPKDIGNKRIEKIISSYYESISERARNMLLVDNNDIAVSRQKKVNEQDRTGRN